MENKVCSKCGAEMPNDAKFCTKCGQSFEKIAPKNHTNKQKLNKKSLYALLAVFATLLLIIFGAMFYSDYSEKREARLAREKFVQDSIKRAEIAAEEARLDEIAKAKAEETRIKEEKEAAQFLAQFTFEKLLNLLDNIENEKYAQKCGLSFLYKDVEIDGDFENMELVYGWQIEKGSKNSRLGYELICNSEHSCYCKYYLPGGAYPCVSLGFKNQDDANRFLKELEKSGHLKSVDDNNYILMKKLPNGEFVAVDGWGGECCISKPRYEKGFYDLTIQ